MRDTRNTTFMWGRQCELSRVVFLLDRPCVFPFIYYGVKRNKCQTMSSSTRWWCALTENYDRDKTWRYCPYGGLMPWSSCGYCKLEKLSNEIILFTATLSRLGFRVDPNSTLCVTNPMAVLTKESLVRMVVCVEVITT